MRNYPLCMGCEVQLKDYRSKRCHSCAQQGKKLSIETRRKISQMTIQKLDIKHLSRIGKLGAQKRWANHIRGNPIQLKNLSPIPRVRKTSEELLARKRFRNQRYKAIKRNATGSHTFEQWLGLKTKYFNMCLCCKQFEPIIKLTEDHIIPLSMGGSDDISNIQPLCQICNTRKHAKFISYLPITNSIFAVS